MAKSKNIEPEVQVTYVSTPDSEIRIANAIDLLLAAAIPHEDYTVRGDENENRENGSSNNEDKGYFAGEGS